MLASIRCASDRSTEPIGIISIAKRVAAAGTTIMVAMRRNAANESPSIISSSVMTWYAPAGLYEVIADEEMLEGLSFASFRRIATMIVGRPADRRKRA